MFEIWGFGILISGWGLGWFSTSGLGIGISGWVLGIIISGWGLSWFTESGFGFIITGWGWTTVFGLPNKSIFGFSLTIPWTLTWGWGCSWISIWGFIGSGSFWILFWFKLPIFSFNPSKNETFSCGFSFSGWGFNLICSILVGSLTCSLSSSLKNDSFGLGLDCAIFILFSFIWFAFPKSANKLTLGFDCSELTLKLIFELRFKLALTFVLKLLFWVFGISFSLSPNNDNLGFTTFCLGSCPNRLSIGFFSEGSLWPANKFTFSVRLAVLSTILEGLSSSSSSLSNIFFNLFLAFSKSLFFLISIAFVSVWFWNKLNCGCIIWGCCIDICTWGGCWFIFSWDICICNCGGLIIWGPCPDGICIWGILFWFSFCWEIDGSSEEGLGIPIIIIVWDGGLFSSLFCIIWLIWGFCSCRGFFRADGFLLKRFELKSS